MAIAFRGAGTPYEPNGDTTSNPLAMPAGVQVGDLLVAVLTSKRSGDVVTPPTGWSALAPAPFTNGSFFKMFAFWKIADGTEGATQTFASDLSPYQGGVVAYSGVDTTTPFNVAGTSTTNASSTSTSLPAITPVTLGAWVVRIASASTGGTITTYTPPTEHTERLDACNQGSVTTVSKRPVEVSDKPWSGSGEEVATTATATTSGLGIGISQALTPATDTTPPAAPTGLTVTLTTTAGD